MTASYDETARVWTSPDCAPLKILKGHDGKVMSIDVNPGSDLGRRGKVVPDLSQFFGSNAAVIFLDVTLAATVSWDRTIKLWAKE